MVSQEYLFEPLWDCRVNIGKRAGIPTDVADKLKTLKREVREVRQANEILRRRSEPDHFGARSSDDRVWRR